MNKGTREPPSFIDPLPPFIPALWIERTCGAAIVRHENQQRVVGQVPFIKFLHQQAHVLVDVDDHPQKGRLVFCRTYL